MFSLRSFERLHRLCEFIPPQSVRGRYLVVNSQGRLFPTYTQVWDSPVSSCASYVIWVSIFFFPESPVVSGMSQVFTEVFDLPLFTCFLPVKVKIRSHLGWGCNWFLGSVLFHLDWLNTFCPSKRASLPFWPAWLGIYEAGVGVCVYVVHRYTNTQQFEMILYWEDIEGILSLVFLARKSKVGLLNCRTHVILQIHFLLKWSPSLEH